MHACTAHSPGKQRTGRKVLARFRGVGSAPRHDAQQLLAEASIHLTEDALSERLVEDLGHEALERLGVLHLDLPDATYDPVKVVDRELVDQRCECALLRLLLRIVRQQLALPENTHPVQACRFYICFAGEPLKHVNA